MLRFILKRRMDNSYDAVTQHYETVDIDAPVLQALLQRGGQGKGGPGYDITELVGVEVLPAKHAASGEGK